MSKPAVFVCAECKKRFNSGSSLHMHMSAMRGRKDHVPKMPQKKRGLISRVLRWMFGRR